MCKKGVALRLFATTILIGAASLSAAEPVPSVAAHKYSFRIIEQPLKDSLNDLSEQSGVRILFPYDDIVSLRARAINGRLTVDEALDRLLAGVPLRARHMGDGTIALSATGPRTLAQRRPTAIRIAQMSTPSNDAALFALAQAPVALAAVDPRPPDEIIVTGTRQVTRTVAESLAPIDVLSNRDFQASGKQSVRDLLGTLMPSINVSNSGAGASFAVKTLSLRGLGGDQLLVLVNGKRRHNAATLFINGTTQNGQSPPDLDLIPANGITRIEVLRDGASAQYGSDAIAGVINIILKDDIAGAASFLSGLTWDGGGEQARAQIDHGFAVGEGVVHLTADGFLQGRTFRSAPNFGQFYAKLGGLYPGPATGVADPREAIVDRHTNRGGQPQAFGVNLGYNANMPVGDAGLYSFGTWSKRHNDAWLTYRFPDATNNIPEIFPLGYSPHLHVYDEDYQFAGGIKGDAFDGLRYDLSTTYAQNHARYVETTALNVSLGPASPTDFHIGKVKATEWTSNLDLQEDFDLGLIEPLSFAVGAEYRENSYRIAAGEPASYIDGGYRSTTGPNGGVVRTSGSQGVTGFPAGAAGRFKRHSWSAYLNLEQSIAEGVEVALAGRHEDYSDFGTTNTGKASIRIEPVRGFAVRGTASTGFRAPTLQQQHYSSASTINVGGVLLPVQALPVDSPAAIALGATPLKAEKSTNFSAGFVFNAVPRLNLTVDAYQVKIRDRILLSETLQGATVINVLRAAGITASAGGFYFSNAADTRTRGLDIVGTYRADLSDLGSANLGLSANINRTAFTHVDQPPAALATAGLVLIGRSKQGDFTKGTPRDKLIANINWVRETLSLNLRATRYGRITQVHPTTPSLDAIIHPRIIVDLEAGVDLSAAIRLSAGANNLFNTYPDKLLPTLQNNGFALYNQYSPYGVSGGFYYAKATFAF
jgi:iron complex outermembrane receptor protein